MTTETVKVTTLWVTCRTCRFPWVAYRTLLNGEILGPIEDECPFCGAKAVIETVARFGDDDDN